jgi:hypothetical protein
MSQPTPPTPSVNALTYNAATGDLVNSFNIPSGVNVVSKTGSTVDLRNGSVYVAMTAVGDTLYGGTNGIATALAGNTTATKKFLTQTGNGSASAAPTWATIVSGDIPAAAIGLSQMANLAANSIIGNNTGSPATPTALSVTNVLDLVGSTRGSILYRGASGWAALTPGTSTYVLTSNGAGADPSWAAAAAGVSGHDPTASHATNAAINGSATTYMRSDAVPAISTTAVLQLARVGLGAAAHASIPLSISDGNVPAAALLSTEYEVISAQSTSPGFNIVAASATAAQRGVFKAVRARGTLASPTASASGDSIFSLLGCGFDGTAVVASAEILMIGDGTVSANTVPQAISFLTGSSGSRTETARFTSNKNLLIGTTSETGLTGGGGLAVASTTDASTSATGSAIFAGGMGIAKKLYVGTNLDVAGPTLLHATARSSGVAAYFTVTTPADTGQTASTESIGTSFTAAIRTWATGALTLQRERVFAAPTYAFAGTSTLTTAINADFADPIAGTNATLTNKYSIRGATVLFTGIMYAGSGPTTLTNAAGNLLLAAHETIANNTVLGNTSGGAAVPSALTGANVRTICGLATTDTPQFTRLGLGVAAQATLALAIAMPAGSSPFQCQVGTAGLWGWGQNQGTGTDDTFGYYSYTGSRVVCQMFTNGNMTIGAALTTGAPAGGTAAAWKFGIYVATPTVPVGYLQVDVAGTLYEVPAKVH